jgi:deoxyribonuclease V
MAGWPGDRDGLAALQRSLASLRPSAWEPEEGMLVGSVFCAFSTAADPAGAERAWTAAVSGRERAVLADEVAAAYGSGYLALREGPLLERAVRALGAPPDVLLVNASGRDRPRGAGLALHLGWMVGVPTVGVTDRPLVATVEGDDLLLGGEVVGSAVVTRPGARPVFAHAAWRTSPGVARSVVAASTGGSRTPEPLRLAPWRVRPGRGTRGGCRAGGTWTGSRRRGSRAADADAGQPRSSGRVRQVGPPSPLREISSPR